MFKTILIPTDGSENSEKAVNAGLELAKKTKAKVIALYVLDYSGLYSLPETYMWENVKGLLDEEGKKALKSIKDAAKKDYISVKTVIREGNPSTEIISAVEEFKADLIVMGTAGRTGLDKFFLGSVSDKVLRTSKTPILIIK